MAMVCQHCATTHEQRLQCPTCGGRLQFHAAGRGLVGPIGHWQHTAWGRVLIGVLLAQGVLYALHHLQTSIFLAVQEGGDTSEAARGWLGIALVQVLQAAALLAGGLVAGHGQKKGAMLGGIVGIGHAVLSVGLFRQSGQPLSPAALLSQPLLGAGVGAFAGWAGSIIWKPLPTLVARGGAPTAPRAKVVRPSGPVFAGPIAWHRVALGTALAVAGSLSATLLFEFLLRASDGTLASSGTALDQLITWEIKALALLAGGTLAGANRTNGLKQGLCVGLGTTLLLAAVESRAPDRWLELTGLLLVSSLCLSLVGGWFGCQLFPPLAPGRAKRSFAQPGLS